MVDVKSGLGLLASELLACQANPAPLSLLRCLDTRQTPCNILPPPFRRACLLTTCLNCSDMGPHPNHPQALAEPGYWSTWQSPCDAMHATHKTNKRCNRDAQTRCDYKQSSCFLLHRHTTLWSRLRHAVSEDWLCICLRAVVG